MIFPIHLSVLRNALLACFPGNQSPTHSTCDDARSHDEDRSRQHDPAAPLQVRDKKEDIHEESK